MKNIFIILIVAALQISKLYAGAAAGAAAGMAQDKVAKEAAKTAAPGMMEKIGNYMGSPPGVAIMATIGTANAYILHDAAAQQEEESNANVAKVEAILKTFTDTMANQCPNGREKLEEPECYCNMEDGTQNPNRTNSQTCQQLWASSKYKMTASATDYSNKTANNPIGCVAVNGQFDQACQCKKLVDGSGNNACMKTVGSTFSTSNPLGMGYLKESGIGHVASALDSMTNGSPNLASISSRGLANAIAQQAMLNGKLYKNLPNAKGFPIFNSNAEVLKAQGSLFPASDLAAVSSAIGGAGSGLPEPTGALAEAINNAKKSTGLEMSGGQGLGKKVAKPSFNMDFGGTGAGGGAVTQNFMDKNYNYKQDDIVKKPESSIFDIISNRYIESGLKRLFEEDK